MKRFAMFMVVVAILASITACDALDSLAGLDPAKILKQLNLQDYGLVTVHISRVGTQTTGGTPINWHVEGWASVPIGFDHLSGETNGLIYGNGRGLAWFDFSGGGCSGYGAWPVTFEVTGFFDGAPKCTVTLQIAETWIGGGTSVASCAGAGGGTAVNPSLGYTFAGMEFNTLNLFAVDDTTAGTPSPGAAGDAFTGWSWNDHWEITYISVPDWVDCAFDFGP